MKKLLVKVINNTVYGKVRRRSLIDDLKVDLENCESCEIFKEKYTKKLYGDDLFLFVNKDFRLIGCTIGAIYQKQFEQYACYYKYSNFRKNRSGLEEHAKLIIRVPAETRIYSKRFNKKYTSISPKMPSLNARLVNYKNKKNEKVNDEMIIGMIEKVNAYIVKNLRNKEALETFEKVSYDTKGGTLLRLFGSEVETYENQLRILNEEKESYRAEKIEWKAEGSWGLKLYNRSKMEIVNWFKCVNLEEV